MPELVARWPLDEQVWFEPKVDGPRVTALMITGGASRQQYARRATEAFLQQTYQNADLLILNDGDWKLDISHPRVREIDLSGSPKASLGELRNLAIEMASGELLVQWDDDDISDKSRIAFQVGAHTGIPGDCVLLCEIVHYDEARRTGRLHMWPFGFPGSILFPKGCGFKYDHLARAEDTLFANQFQRKIVVESLCPLYCYVYHGENTWEKAHILGASESSDIAFLENSFCNHCMKSWHALFREQTACSRKLPLLPAVSAWIYSRALDSVETR